MAINRLTHGIDEEKVKLVIDHLEKVILDLRPVGGGRYGGPGVQIDGISIVIHQRKASRLPDASPGFFASSWK